MIDSISKQPLTNIQILSENGSYIGSSDMSGEFQIDWDTLKNKNIRSIMFSGTDYFSSEISISKLPEIISLLKIKTQEVETVSIRYKYQKKYFTVQGYFRSWQLLNNKLTKYGEGIIEYHIPIDSSKLDKTDIKKFITQYRTFSLDSIYKNPTKVTVKYFNNVYLYNYIPKIDLYNRNKNYFDIKIINDNLSNLSKLDEGGKTTGSISFDVQKFPMKTIYMRDSSFDLNGNPIKVIDERYSHKYYVVEEWTGQNTFRHLTYTFYDYKNKVKAANKNEFNDLESVFEIFIDDNVIFDDKAPEKYKKKPSETESFYTTEFWKSHLEKNPLPSEIQNQISKLKPNANKYK